MWRNKAQGTNSDRGEMLCVWRVVRKSLSEEKTLKLGVMTVGGSHGGIQGKRLMCRMAMCWLCLREIKDASAVCATEKEAGTQLTEWW